MLTLTLVREDRIKIGDDIEILIVYTAESRVRIGISAPKHVRIERKPKPKQPDSSPNPSTDEMS
jgi:carbon storage regulator CsrA